MPVSARTKRRRRSYGAGEWGRNRVTVFPDPKTGLFQIEWPEDGRRLTRSLKQRVWVRTKRRADEFTAGFIDPAPRGQAEGEPEPLAPEKLFDVYDEEVTPTKAEASQQAGRAATKMFLQSFGGGRRPSTLSRRDWDPSAAVGQGWTERQAGVRRDARTRPEVPDRRVQLGGDVEGRTRPPASRPEPAEAPEDNHGEEPYAGGVFRGGIRIEGDTNLRAHHGTAGGSP